jgi:hypothetical protein
MLQLGSNFAKETFMTQMPPPLDAPVVSANFTKRPGTGKLACWITLIAGAAIITSVMGQFGHVMFSASIALWAIGFLLTLAGLLPGRKKSWAFLALLLNIALAAWFAVSLNP